MSYIVSAVIFLFIRCFVKDRWELNFQNEIITPDTDALEQKQITISVFQAFCAPMIATFMFFYNKHQNIDETVLKIAKIF